MNTHARLLLFALLLVFSSCNRNKVKLVDTNAKDEVPQLGNLIFTFDKNLSPDSLLNQWSSEKYITFSPEIPGQFRWQNVNELVFSPERELAPATTYTATLNGLITRKSKLSLGGNTSLTFHTADIALQAANALWVVRDETTRDVVLQLDFQFNYTINPDKLKSLLKITIEGKERDFIVQGTQPDSRVAVIVQGMKLEDKDLAGKVTIAKGLVPVGGTNAGKEPLEAALNISSPFSIVVSAVEAEHDGLAGKIKVYTSQAALSAGLTNYISIEPAVPFQVTVESDGISITGEDFDVSKSYSLTLRKGLKGVIGGTLREDYSTQVGFGKLEPGISFVSTSGLYLGSKGNRNMELRITGVPKVRVVISKVYENNLLAAKKYDYYPASYTAEGSEYDYEYYNYNDGVQLGDIIYDEVIETKNLPKNGASRLLKLDAADKLGDYKGIYHVQVRSTEEYWVRDAKMISLSDIGLIVRETKSSVCIFANSISGAAALGGVSIQVYGRNNQVVGTGTTDNSGYAEIRLKEKNYAGFSPAMITAKHGADFNYLIFQGSKVETSRFDVGGKHTNLSGLDVFIYGDRDIYRPGEKINVCAIVRDRNWKSPGDMPVKMKLLLPNGKDLKAIKKTLNEEGSADAVFELSDAAVTGNYTIEVYSGNDVLIGSKSVLIEEFMPDRIKVTTKVDKESLRPTENLALSFHAESFFGPPAANRNYEMEIQVAQQIFSPRRYPAFSFSLGNIDAYYEKQERNGQTDENGNATQLYQVPANYVNRGLLRTSIFTTVFDETGRPVNRKNDVRIFTQEVFLGIGQDGYNYFPLNQPLSFPVIALNKEERLLNNARARMQVIKHEYRTVLTRYDDYFRYESQKNDKVVYDADITISGENTVFSYTARSSGDYEIRLMLPGADSYVQRQFYCYGWGDGNTGFEVNKEGHVDIALDKERYVCGENARVLFKAPFNGRMLVTVETDKVVEHRYLEVKNRAASMDLKLTEGLLPNAYITATVIKPHEESDMPLTVAHGYTSVTVEDKARRQEVKITAAATSRSHTHQKVKVKAPAGSMITFAAVDEGILQITGFKTPDPYSYFYQKRALEINAYDLYPLLFPEIKGRLSSTGGDGFDLSKRVNPIQNKRVKLLAYWSGITAAGGETEFEFDVPAFSGQVRMMAVTHKGNAFGSAEATMVVADPLVVSTALPRFLSPGDTAVVPVTISNTTAHSGKAVAGIRTGGPLRLVGDVRQAVAVGANSEGRVEFRVVADRKIGAGKVLVTVDWPGESFTDETDIAVRPAASLQKANGAGNVAGGATQTIRIGSNDFIAGSQDYSLVVSKSPVLEFGRQLEQLVNYPYGCTEQTVSAAFPQLYYADLADNMHLNTGQKGNAAYHVQEAIRKIKMRQLYNGALTLWDSEGTENWWATVYAAHFLLEAKKAGFDVETQLLESLFNYMQQRLRNREFITYYYNRDARKQIAPKEVAYSLYVLALAGKPQVSSMNYYKQHADVLALDSKYLLSAAFALAGDKAKFRELLPASFSGEASVAQTGESFYSEVRDEAVALNALLEAEPGHSQIGVMAGHLSQAFKNRRYLSTQECAFGLLALGKIARQANKAVVTADIRVNGKAVARFDGNTTRLSPGQLGGATVELVTKGSGKLYYFWQAEGISASGTVREEDSYLKVRKQFYNRNGQPVQGNSFKQNELLIVAITLESAYSRVVENVVITDMLPAGFEIENPRTKEIPGMDWIKNAATPAHIDIRDDRINLFTDAAQKPQTYYYAVRAVSLGNFKMGPVMADAMYNGEYHSYSGSGAIKVVR
jgi:uncharacterized protein YfaS (alpha-2-macroglobulin family)